MIKILAKKENNLFQSPVWADFQRAVGKEPQDLSGSLALKTKIFGNKDFYWIQRGPKSLKSFKPDWTQENKVVFARVEPFEVTPEIIKLLKLKEVTRTSLLGGQKTPKATRVVDLTKHEEEIMAEMKPKTRYNIRLAEKKGIKIRISTDPADASLIYNLLEKTESRGKGYHHFEKNYYQKMMEVLCPAGYLYLILAEQDSQPLAGALVSVFGEVATYLHGGFDVEKRNLMAPFLVQWAGIRLGKEKGARLYDFWGIAETDDPKDSWSGITKFKEGFGGEKVLFPGAFDYVVQPFWYNMLTIVANLRRLIK